jgi:hypothetical protein
VDPNTPNINPDAKNIFYEVVHVHPEDYSMHAYLSPRDARLVVERGWGLRFPVAWIAPPSWVMVYAPRNLDELGTVIEIIRAACCYAVGTELERLPLFAGPMEPRLYPRPESYP